MAKHNKPSPKFLKMAEIYRIFAQPWAHMLDFSDTALREMYDYESRGISITRSDNGFEVGKRWLNVHVKWWREDKYGYELKHVGKVTDLDNILELYTSHKYPHWWLNSVLGEG